MLQLALTILGVILLGGGAMAQGGAPTGLQGGSQAGPKVAIFPFELIDDSLEGQYIGVNAAETQRLALATEELRRLVAHGSDYQVLDISGLASDIAREAPLYKCNGCEVELARRAGAQVAITLAVRKFSSMLLSLHVYVTDVATGKLTKMYRVDLRGNSDEVWLKGVRRLVAESLARG
jgi:hypothetical protein